MSAQHNPEVSAYIARSAAFAQPVLQHLRALVHKACPAVEEELKWSMPFFSYKGPVCNMAAFKAHCAFGFWKQQLLIEAADNRNAEAMGQFGRITSLADLPGDAELLKLIRRAVELNEAGIKKEPRPRTATPPVVVPKDLAAALAKNKAAKASFEGFSPSNRRDYVDWLTEAKTEATRARRLATAIEWMSEGKIRNWKYVRK